MLFRYGQTNKYGQLQKKNIKNEDCTVKVREEENNVDAISTSEIFPDLRGIFAGNVFFYTRHLLLYMGRAFMYTPVVCHFSNFYTAGDFHHVQKEAAIPYFSCGCNIFDTYINI